MVLLEAGKLPHKNYLNIWNLKELRGIEVTDEHVTLGALTTYSEVQAQCDPARRISHALPGGQRDRRAGDSESRHVGRQHRECFAGG